MRRPETFRRVSVLLGLGLLWPLACDDDRGPLGEVCPSLSSDCPAVLPSYTSEIAPIIATHCGQCHTRDDPSPRAPWPLDDPLDVVDWSSSIRADLSDCVMPPPDTDAPLSDADRETLHIWLSCGAPIDGP